MPDSPERAALLRTAREAAIRYVGVSARTSGAVAGKLLRSGFPAEIVEATVAALSADGYLKDEAVARTVAARADGKNAESKAALRARLLRRGVPEAVADRTAGGVPEDAITARALLKTKFASDLDAASDDAVTVRLAGRMARFLASRGYGAETAEECIRAVLEGRNGPG